MDDDTGADMLEAFTGSPIGLALGVAIILLTITAFVLFTRARRANNTPGMLGALMVSLAAVGLWNVAGFVDGPPYSPVLVFSAAIWVAVVVYTVRSYFRARAISRRDGAL